MKQVNKTIESFFLCFSLFVYLILFLWIVVFTYISPLELFSQDRVFIQSVNLIPFHEIGQYLTGSVNVSRSVVVTNLLGNIGVFIPLGIYLQMFKEDKRFFRA